MLLSGNMFKEALLDVFNLFFELGFSLSLDLLWLLFLSFLWCILGIISKFLHDLEILLSSEFSLEDLLHGLFFSTSGLIKRLAELHNRDSSFSISNSGHVLVHRDGSQWRITDLLTVSDFVLSVVKVPHIKETVDSCQEEKTASSWRPATVCEIS